MPTSSSDKPTLAVAGATSSPAAAFPDRLSDDYRLIGLTRHPDSASRGDDRWEWRRCDLYDGDEVDRALEGVDCVVYLAHTARPSARLTQASATDLDILCADNLARAAADHGVERLVHVSTILNESDPYGKTPATDELSEALGTTGIPVTTLETDLVIGPGGTTARTLERLVTRLPMMICPSWTEIPLRIVGPDRIADAVADALAAERPDGASREITPSVRATYRQLLETTADLLDKPRLIVGAPVDWAWLSTLWVAVFAGLPPRLLRRFLEQIIRLRDRSSLEDVDSEAVEPMLRKAFEVDDDTALISTDDSDQLPIHSERRAGAQLVRSVQRLPAPPDRDARWAADEYLRWLEAELGPLLRVEVDEHRTCRFYAPVLPTALLVLEHRPDWSHANLELFDIAGGLLAAGDDPGRLEFRLVLGGRAMLAAIHDFRPALPWFVYRWTQALVHRAVVERFGRHLAEIGPAESA